MTDENENRKKLDEQFNSIDPNDVKKWYAQNPKPEYEYVRLNRIKECNARYNILIGKRSNGKTYAVLEEILKQYHENGANAAIIRRTDEDFKSARARQMWQNLVVNGLVDKYTDGVWNDIVYYNSAWYFAKYDVDLQKTVRASAPFCYKFALNTMEHDKSTSYPAIKYVLFDEFIARGMYLVDEFILFQNTISTIIRNNDNVIIYMLGNTVNRYCPYFEEMGLINIKNMKPGDLDVYTYGENSELCVAVEFTGTQPSRSDVYFAFNNPKLKMITQGAWELDIYPHLPEKYAPTDVKFYFVIEFDHEILQGELVCKNHDMYIYIHRKTTPIRDTDFVFSTQWNKSPRYSRNILHPQFTWGKRVADLFRYDRVFYQNNTVGNIVYNYINWCKQN